MRELKITGYACGLAATVAGFGLYSYAARELLAAFAIFSVVFLSLALVALCALLLWFASVQVVIRTGSLSRNVAAFSRRLIAVYVKS
ncbi:MAG: hypothetical protein WBE87_08175 [Candidatus Acidiferrales bacterium]